jgi:hypothetical protein
MEAATAQAGNGTVPMTARDKIAHDLEAEIARIDEERDELSVRLATLNEEAKTFKQSLQRLRGEPLIKHSGGRMPGSKTKPSTRAGRPTAVGDERLAEIRAAVLAWARDHDEFRQVDLRTMTGHTSSTMATAFETLRQDGMIRLARKEGVAKVFRLTTEGMRLRDEDVA